MRCKPSLSPVIQQTDYSLVPRVGAAVEVWRISLASGRTTSAGAGKPRQLLRCAILSASHVFEGSVSMSRKVKCGNEFDAEVRIVHTTASDLVAKLVLFVGVLFLIGAAVYSVFKADFSYVAGVWSAVAPIYAGIAGYYFGSARPPSR